LLSWLDSSLYIECRKPVTRFLALPVCNVATAQSFFSVLVREIESRNIPWTNVIGFASGTASVMAGKRNSVFIRLIEKQHKLFSLGCLCHLAALCASAAQNCPFLIHAIGISLPLWCYLISITIYIIFSG